MDPLDIVFDILVSAFCSTLVPCLFLTNYCDKVSTEVSILPYLKVFT
jgi:hypothetical protein